MSETNGHAEAVAVAKDGEGVVELQAIDLDPQAGSSTQRDDESALWTPDDTISPPEDLSALCRLTEFSGIRGRCIEAVTLNTVGLGWDIEPWPDQPGDHKDLILEARHRVDVLARRDRRLDRPSFTALMKAVKEDREECGQGYMEVSRNRRTGAIDGLFHLPGKLMRRKRDRSGYVMGQNPGLAGADATRSDYYNFGEKVEYDAAGRPVNRLANRYGGGGWKQNEVIVFRNYTSESRDYGLPRDAAMAVEYAAARFVNEWTGSFFQRSGVPPTVLFVQGQERRDGTRVRFSVPNATIRRIEQAVRTDGEPGAAVVVIPVPPGTDVKDVKLSQLTDRDLTFSEFKKLHDTHVGRQFGLMPIFYDPSLGEGRYTAEVERAITLEQTFDPDQRDIEDKLWTTLMADLGYSELRIAFKRMAVESDAARREAVQNGANIGAVTYGEWRKANGLAPLPYDGEADDAENPNNQLIEPMGPVPEQHSPVDVAATQDQRGLRPGIAGRSRKRAPVAKHDGVPHVEEEVDQLAAELAEYGPVARDA